MGETREARHARYRARGWWPGERLTAHYDRVAGERPRALAVADDLGGWLSHEQLRERARDLSTALEGIGVRARDVVLLFMPNRVDWQVAMLAALELGAVPASLPIRTDPDTLRHVIELCGARIVVTLETHRATVAVVAAQCPVPPGVVTLEDGEARVHAGPGHRSKPILPAPVDSTLR